MGLTFETPFGTAGGLDKSAKDLETWNKWGAGFIEVGTFTPKPQGPNPGKIIDRDKKSQALWNCMGFPNSGFEAVRPRIKKFKQKNSTPVFINIGKNRDTPLAEASKDYVAGIKYFGNLADCFVVNISSPNTKDLRLLHSKENFREFIGPVLEASLSLSKKTPLLVKLSPDLDDDYFRQFISDASSLPLDGFILTNTTQSRPLGSDFPERGGLSGGPLKELSISKLKLARECLGSESSKCLVSVGGVMDPQDAVERLKLGADLVQAYSGLIFYGPSLLIDSAKKL
jgi:dihydroorotate dehydrogenase